jgi:hypothetical protein
MLLITTVMVFTSRKIIFFNTLYSQKIGNTMNTQFKRLALCSLVGLFASQAYAHTGVRDQVDDGKASYNGFTITHGCNAVAEGGAYAEQYPVVGQAAVFPTFENAVWKKLKAGSTSVATPADLEIIATGGDGAGTIPPVVEPARGLNLAVTGYAGFSSAFATTQELVDPADGVVHGLLYKDGAMEPRLNTVTPFKITAPKIVNGCVKSLKVRVAVVNWCDTKANAANDAKGPWYAPKDAFGRAIPRVHGADNNGIQRNVAGAKVYTTMAKGNGDDNRADWWFSALEGGSENFKDPDVLQPVYWTTMTINNTDAVGDTVCNGTKYDVYVEPNGKEVDTYLTGPNTQPFTKGTSDF